MAEQLFRKQLMWVRFLLLAPKFNAGLAQLAAQLTCNEKVGDSTSSPGTNFRSLTQLGRVPDF